MCEDQSAGERFTEFFIATWAKISARWRRLLRPGTTTAMVVVTLYAAGGLLKAQEVPDAGTWKAGELANTVWTGTGVLAGLAALLVAVGYRRALTKATEQSELYVACRSAVSVVQAATGIEPRALAGHVWTISGFPGARHLVRRATFKFERRPPSPVTWRKGKGALGKCWATLEESVENLQVLHDLELDKNGFCELKKKDRLALNWTEYSHTRHYSAIWVTPIFRGEPGARRIAGCMSIDVIGVPDAAALLDAATADNAELRGVLTVCHTVL